jgi:hypothetical protein
MDPAQRTLFAKAHILANKTVQFIIKDLITKHEEASLEDAAVQSAVLPRLPP